MRSVIDAESVLGTTRRRRRPLGVRLWKRTPVLIDVNGVSLRESLSYHGGGAGFGGQMAKWLPPAQSADAALLPALRLGNAQTIWCAITE